MDGHQRSSRLDGPQNRLNMVISNEPDKNSTSIDRAVQRQNASLRALHETALGLLDKIDKEELLETIIERAAALTGTQHGYIYLLDPDAQ
jgi:hypothetical protein